MAHKDVIRQGKARLQNHALPLPPIGDAKLVALGCGRTQSMATLPALSRAVFLCLILRFCLMSAKVCVKGYNGNTLYPTTRCGHVRWLLKNGKAKVIRKKAFPNSTSLSGGEKI